ncbi:MAG: hypothetical protein WA919_22020, partial [Coleofasciculaceae cyanobacterium]
SMNESNDSLLGSVVYARGSRSPSCLKARGSPTPPSEPRFPVAEGNVIKSRVFPGLWLAAEDLLAGNMTRVLSVLQEGLASAEHGSFVEKLD